MDTCLEDEEEACEEEELLLLLLLLLLGFDRDAEESDMREEYASNCASVCVFKRVKNEYKIAGSLCDSTHTLA